MLREKTFHGPGRFGEESSLIVHGDELFPVSHAWPQPGSAGSAFMSRFRAEPKIDAPRNNLFETFDAYGAVGRYVFWKAYSRYVNRDNATKEEACSSHSWRTMYVYCTAASKHALISVLLDEVDRYRCLTQKDADYMTGAWATEMQAFVDVLVELDDAREQALRLENVRDEDMSNTKRSPSGTSVEYRPSAVVAVGAIGLLMPRTGKDVATKWRNAISAEGPIASDVVMSTTLSAMFKSLKMYQSYFFYRVLTETNEHVNWYLRYHVCSDLRLFYYYIHDTPKTRETMLIFLLARTIDLLATQTSKKSCFSVAMTRELDEWSQRRRSVMEEIELLDSPQLPRISVVYSLPDDVNVILEEKDHHTFRFLTAGYGLSELEDPKFVQTYVTMLRESPNVADIMAYAQCPDLLCYGYRGDDHVSVGAPPAVRYMYDAYISLVVRKLSLDAYIPIMYVEGERMKMSCSWTCPRKDALRKYKRILIQGPLWYNHAILYDVRVHKGVITNIVVYNSHTRTDAFLAGPDAQAIANLLKEKGFTLANDITVHLAQNVPDQETTPDCVFHSMIALYFLVMGGNFDKTRVVIRQSAKDFFRSTLTFIANLLYLTSHELPQSWITSMFQSRDAIDVVKAITTHAEDHTTPKLPAYGTYNNTPIMPMFDNTTETSDSEVLSVNLASRSVFTMCPLELNISGGSWKRIDQWLKATQCVLFVPGTVYRDESAHFAAIEPYVKDLRLATNVVAVPDSEYDNYLNKTMLSPKRIERLAEHVVQKARALKPRAIFYVCGNSPPYAPLTSITADRKHRSALLSVYQSCTHVVVTADITKRKR